MSLPLLVAVLLAAAAAESRLGLALDLPLWTRTTLGVSLMAGVPAFAAGLARGVRAKSARQASPGPDCSPAARRADRWLSAAWFTVMLLVLLGLDWPAPVRDGLGWRALSLPGIAWALMPVVAPLVAGRVLLGEPRTAPRSLRGRLCAAGAIFRREMSLLIVPLMALAAWRQVVSGAVGRELSQPEEGLAGGVGLALVACGFSRLLRWSWQAQPLPAGRLRERLEAVGDWLGFRPREILVWETGQRVVNAAVAGFGPRSQFVFLSDGLLATLSDEELVAVFGHEAGHARHHHLVLRLLALTAPCAWLAGAQALAVAPLGAQASSVWLGAAAAAGFGLWGWLAFGWYARQLEYQADLVGCEATAWSLARDGDGTLAPPAGAYGTDVWPTAAQAYGRALARLSRLNGLDPMGEGWQHASLVRRLAHVQRAAAEASAAAPGRLAWISALLVGSVAGSLAAALSPLWR